jgi:hypothetical protein
MRNFITCALRLIKSRKMRWAGRIACMGEMRNAYNILVGKPEERRLLGRSRSRWEGKVRIYLMEIG